MDHVAATGHMVAQHLAATEYVQESVQEAASRPVEEVATQQINTSVQAAEEVARSTAEAAKDFGESTARAAQGAVANAANGNANSSMISSGSWTSDDWFGFTFGILTCAALVWTGWSVYKMSKCKCKGRCNC